MKLMVRSGKKPPFHPTLRIDKYSGFCANQWTGQMFKPGCYPGMNCVATVRNVADMVARYLADLERCGHRRDDAS